MSTLDLEGLKALLEKATEGPWAWFKHSPDDQVVFHGEWRIAPGVLLAEELSGTPGGDEIDRANADLIVALVNAAPELIAAEERAQRAEADFANACDVGRRLEAQLTASQARIRELEAGLKKCQEQFRFYAQQHAAKSPPDYTKAQTNLDMVSMCEGLIQQPVEGDKP